MNVEKWFLANARVTRAAAAEFAGVEVEDVDIEADELGLGRRLNLRELSEVIEALEEEGDDIEDDEDEEDDNEEDEDEPDEAVDESA